uniref:centromere protein U n=1 Tax=Scatophagus argus TaxID=75038 RepID=UPI001ED85B63|nr:centromere protein U [Scatophagus argus]
MSAKKGRRAKVLKVPQDENPKDSSLDNVDSPDLSAIEKVSFLEGLQLNYGNPLHSTAMEEDLNQLEDGPANKEKAGRTDIPQTLKTAVKQRGSAVKRKETERDEEEEEKKKRRRKLKTGKVQASLEKAGEAKKKNKTPQGERAKLDVERKESDQSPILQEDQQATQPAGRLKHLVVKKPKRKEKSAGWTSAVRQRKNQHMKNGKKTESESGSGKSSDSLSHEESDPGTTKRGRKYILSSDEEVVDEDISWNPSPKKAKVRSLDRIRQSSSDTAKSRKLSSGSASAKAEKTNTDKQRRKRRGRQGGTELEVLLDAFLDFCEQYRESVESKAVKQSIYYFSSNVKEQLLEKISSYKEIRALKRENAKVGSLIRTKTQRLLDAKYELMRAEKQQWLLQKEKAELELRLADLRQSQAFLHDISELNRQYLGFRHKHPKEKETYGASSLAALLWETKHIHSTDHQLRDINNRLEKRLRETETLK